MSDFERMRGALRDVSLLVLPSDSAGWETFLLASGRSTVSLNGKNFEDKRAEADVYLDVRRASLFTPKIIKGILGRYESSLIYIRNTKESEEDVLRKYLFSLTVR